MDQPADGPRAEDLVVERPEGLYRPPGDFYIDPWRPVDRAVITHAHADHARSGHAHVLAASIGEGLLRKRLGADFAFHGLAYGRAVEHRGVRVSLHPAGHVLGSAQVRLEHGGRVWVVSGDHHAGSHDGPNPTCAPFEPVRCDVFVTESTFALPIYRWRPEAELTAAINAWWAGNAADGRASLLLGYSLGKAQRLIAGLDASIGPILVHGAVAPLNDVYRAAGVRLPATSTIPEFTGGDRRKPLAGCIVVAPPSAQSGPWARRLGERSDAFASGWMQLRGARRRRGVDRGFVVSDHADWPGLHEAIGATGAERVIVTHGAEAVLVRWLREQGLQAGSFRTEYGERDDDDGGGTPAGAHADAALATSEADEPHEAADAFDAAAAGAAR